MYLCRYCFISNNSVRNYTYKLLKTFCKRFEIEHISVSLTLAFINNVKHIKYCIENEAYNFEENMA